MTQKVIIFLCTYNGARFLSDQLDSIVNQSYKNWKIIASDEGSTDGTLNIFKKYQHELGKDCLEVVNGPKKGFAANFLSLISHENISSNHYYAYSDQDDIWKPDKLERALQWIKTMPSNLPALYCSRTELINENGQSWIYSRCAI